MYRLLKACTTDISVTTESCPCIWMPVITWCVAVVPLITHRWFPGAHRTVVAGLTDAPRAVGGTQTVSGGEVVVVRGSGRPGPEHTEVSYTEQRGL